MTSEQGPIPHRRRPSKKLLSFTIFPMVAIGIAANLALPLRPGLIKDPGGHPLLLLALDPRSQNLILVGARISAVAYFTVVIIRRLLVDPCYFFIGRWYGEAAVRWLRKTSPEIATIAVKLEEWFPRIGPLLILLYPHPLVMVMAGASTMGFLAFFLYDLIGTIVIVVLVRELGFAFEGPVQWLTKYISEYWIPLTALSVILFFYLMWSGRGDSGEGKLDSVSRIEESLEEEANRDETIRDEPQMREPRRVEWRDPDQA